MQRLSDTVLDVFIFFGLIGFFLGLAAPIVGLLWAAVRWFL